MTRFSRRLPVALAAGAAGLLALSSVPAHAAPAATPAPAPRVVAHPDDVKVGAVTHLVGTGFAPATSVEVKECESTSWIVPQDPCADNAVTVRVTSAGTFRHSLVAESCDVVSPGTDPAVAERCYVGVPKPTGVDTITLVGATPLTVTGVPKG